MDPSNCEKTNKPRSTGILGYFQKNCSTSAQNKVQTQDDVNGSGELVKDKAQSSSPEVDKENKSKLIVKMKPRGERKKRKKVELEESSTDEEMNDVLSSSSRKKKIRVSPSEIQPSSPEQDLDIEKVASVPKADIIDVDEDTPKPSKPKKSISSFFRKVTKEERLQNEEKESSVVQVKAIIHESPEDKKSHKLKDTSFKKEKSKRAKKSNVSVPAAESEKIELVEVDEIVENSCSEEQEKEAAVLSEEKTDADANVDVVHTKISSNIFKSKRRKGEKSNNEDDDNDSDNSVNMESLENSPVKGHGDLNETVRKEQPVISPPSSKKSRDNLDGRPNAFATLMKNSRRSFEPEEKAEVEEKAPVVTKKEPMDETLKKMLTALHSVHDVEEEEACDLEVRNIVSSKRRKRKGKRKVKRKADEDEDVFDVKCKDTVGKFHLTRMSSEGKGQCIQVDDVWMTPQDFEKFSGSKAKKYKTSLSINSQPFGEFLEERNIRTPSRGGLNSGEGRGTPGSRGSSSSTPTVTVSPRSRSSSGERSQIKRRKSLIDPNQDCEEEERGSPVTPVIGTPKNSRKQRTRKLPVQLPDTGASDPELLDSPGPGRRSGRIARKASLFDERKKQQEEQERQLEESDKKIELERKIRNAAVAKQRKLLERRASQSQSQDNSDSDCQVEEVVNSPSTKRKVASIFMKQKKPVKPVEDETVVAARKAFLMSSAPASLRTVMTGESEGRREERGLVWPGPHTLPSHTGLHLSSLTSRPGPWTYSDRTCDPPLALSLDRTCDPPLALSLTLNTTPADLPLTSGRPLVRMDEAGVLATVQSLLERKTFPSVKMFNSLVERKVEAELFEREAREKNLSVCDVEEKRIRGNKRRSRRSLELKGESVAGRYEVGGRSGLLWTSKYQPRCGADIIGNKATVEGLRNWLRTWSGAGAASHNSDLTSDLTSDEHLSDSEYEADSVDIAAQGNIALLAGSSGSGKTATVFALAAELGFKVLEANASSNRTGKQMLSMLSEATQSQQVRRGEEKMLSFFSQKKKEDTDTSANSKKMKTALILLEDIDLVLEDEGFYSAVNTLSQISKRPIVMTVSNKTWFVEGAGTVGEKVLKFLPKTFYMYRYKEEELASHLQTIALVEGYHISRSDLKSKVMKRELGVRGAILQLQLYCSSGLTEVDCGLEDEVEGEEDGEGSVDMNWFKHLDLKTRRAGVVSPAVGLASDLATGWRYDSEAWWDSLPGGRVVPTRLVRYPLTHLDTATASFKRIDPLKNKELFDTEESDGEEDTEKKPEARSQELEATKATVSREERAANYKSLSCLSSHLDLVSEWCQEEEHTAPTVLKPFPGGGMSQDLPQDRCQVEDRLAVEAEYSRFLLSRSTETVSRDLLSSSSEMQLLPLDWKEYHRLASECQREPLTYGLMDIVLPDRMSRMDLMAGLRTMARSEEVRRIQSSQERRGYKFRHYFSLDGIPLEESFIHTLCNALID